MISPLSRLIARGAYAATQLPRVAWYVGHGLAMRQLSAWARQRAGKTARPRARTKLATPDRSRLYADMARLLRQDLANVEAGIYPLPTDHDVPARSHHGRPRRRLQCARSCAPLSPLLPAIDAAASAMRSRRPQASSTAGARRQARYRQRASSTGSSRLPRSAFRLVRGRGEIG